MNQITIFGGSGFIGRHIVRRLAKAGVTIRVPTRDPEKALPLKPMGDVGQIVPFACSSRSDTSVAEAIGDSQAVINLLGILYEKGHDSFQSVHVEAAARIARLAKEQGVKHLVHFSALGADPLSRSAYARSKAGGEEAVRAFFPDSVLLRPSIVFGPEDSFFNRFASLSRFSPMLPLIGGGHTKFQPVYVGDVADAVMAVLAQAEARGQIYELGGPAVYSFRELLTIMLKEIGRKRCFVALPWGLAKTEAFFLEMMSCPLLTRDQVELLKSDNAIQDRNAKILRDLGVALTALELILPSYLSRFRPGGQAMLSERVV